MAFSLLKYILEMDLHRDAHLSVHKFCAWRDKCRLGLRKKKKKKRKKKGNEVPGLLPNFHVAALTPGAWCPSSSPQPPEVGLGGILKRSSAHRTCPLSQCWWVTKRRSKPRFSQSAAWVPNTPSYPLINTLAASSKPQTMHPVGNTTFTKSPTLFSPTGLCKMNLWSLGDKLWSLCIIKTINQRKTGSPIKEKVYDMPVMVVISTNNDFKDKWVLIY